ncbi:MAG: hypothetical protein ACYC7L_03245 [Nitrospirota bacterium]
MRKSVIRSFRRLRREPVRPGLDIENSLMIKRVFDRFESADRQLANVLGTLRDRKKEHLKRLEVQSAPLAPRRQISPAMRYALRMKNGLPLGPFF